MPNQILVSLTTEGSAAAHAATGLTAWGWLLVAMPLAGAALLLLSNAVWLVSHYRRRFRADNAIAAAFYFAGHFLIVRALYL